MIGAKFVLCNRVQSPKPQKGGGWLHATGEKRTVAPQRVTKTSWAAQLNCSRLIMEWAAETSIDALDDFAVRLGVSVDALAALNACYAHQHRAWAFPMLDGHGSPVGIRLRADDGRKWAVKGSKQGIFLPEIEPQKTVFVCEGPTDTSAALSLGLYAIGRPSCNCGGLEIKTACKRLGVTRAVIVADNDTPGLQGAEKIKGELKMPSCIYVPPAKDLRQFLALGGTKLMIENEIRHTVWRK